MVKHLPPAIKQLLTLRNPGVLPSPPAVKLNEVLASTLHEAKEKEAERGWLVLTTCTLLTKNRPSSVADLYRFATRSDPFAPESRQSEADAIDKAAVMRESALKSTIFVGVPRVILSLSAMTEAFEEDVKRGLRADSHREANTKNIDRIMERGRALWESIYEPHAEKLYNKLGSYHPDFITFIIQSYGAVLSPLPLQDNQQGNLSRTLGSVVGTACLRAEQRVVPQLTSHVFGLLKARNVQGQSLGDQWLSSDQGTQWSINAVDRICDVLDDVRSPSCDTRRSKLSVLN